MERREKKNSSDQVKSTNSLKTYSAVEKYIYKRDIQHLSHKIIFEAQKKLAKIQITDEKIQQRIWD